MPLINTIGSNGMSIATPAQQNCIVGDAMTVSPGSNLTLSPTGGTSPYTFTAEDTLPAGLSLSAGGVISGTPTTAAGATVYRVRIEDTDGGAIRVGITFHIAAALEIANGLDSATTVGMTDNTAFSYQLYATGGRAPYTWAEQSGTRNTGISDVTSAGVVAGTPTDDTETASMVYRVTDANGTTADTATISHPVNAALAVGAASFTWIEGDIEVDSVTATGGTDPIRWQLNATTEFLPDGFARIYESTNKSVVIFGKIPSGFGSGTNFTLKAIDSGGGDLAGDEATGLMTITVSV